MKKSIKYFLSFGLLFRSLQLTAQVVDSLVVESNLFAVVSADYENQFLNANEHGFILYGGVSKPKKKGFAGHTTTFMINHYDTSFSLAPTTIEMPQKVGPTSIYQTLTCVYFLIQPQLSGTGIAYLIKYDLTTKIYKLYTLHNDWKSSQGLDFVVSGNFLYVKYERAENGGYGVLVYRPYLEVFDLTKEKIKEVDLTFKDYSGYELNGIGFLKPRNISDTVYVQFHYKGDGKQNTSENTSRRIQGFYNGKMLMDGIVSGSGYFLSDTYVIGCGDRVNFWQIYPAYDSMFVSLSYLTASQFIDNGKISDANCYPNVSSYGWSIREPKRSSFISVDQDFSEDDFRNGRYDRPVRIQKFIEGLKVLDTSTLVFKSAERTVLPYPYYFIANRSKVDGSEFIISSWQKLYSYKIDESNRLIEKYSIHLPPHLEEGIESPPLHSRTWEAFRNKSQLASKFDIQYGYRSFYYFISIVEKQGYGGFTFKLYKCSF